jgi:FkbM family methyltransferase
MKQQGEWKVTDQESDQWVLDFTNNHSIGDDSWQEHFVTYLLPFCTKSRTCIDIGASYGLVSAALANHFNQVHSFEIVDSVRECLKENLKRFDNVKIYNTGLSNTEKTVKLNIAEDITGSSMIYTGWDIPNTTNKLVEVQVTSLDQYEFDSVDLIKIDVEGHEHDILQGARKTLKQHWPVLVVEMWTYRNKVSDINRRRTIDFLNSLGYEIADVRQHDFVFVKRH